MAMLYPTHKKVAQIPPHFKICSVKEVRGGGGGYVAAGSGGSIYVLC
jgi:hypothetical protein